MRQAVRKPHTFIINVQIDRQRTLDGESAAQESG
jgi:hypothetical protein